VGGAASFGSLFGAAATWNFTPNLTWNAAQAHLGYFNGKLYEEVSSQLQWAFNPSPAAVASAQARRLSKAKAALKKQGLSASYDEMLPAQAVNTTAGDCAEFAGVNGELRDSGRPCGRMAANQ